VKTLAPAWRADLFAGVTVALVLIPQSLAYAELAGMPAHHGLYASTIPLIVAAFFASSPYLQTGPVALTSLLVFAALAPRATPGTGEYVALAAVLALLVGAIRLGLGLARAGGLVRVLTPPVVRGFTTGAALLILASQVPSFLGVDVADAGLIGGAVRALSAPGAWLPAAGVLGAATLGLMVAGPRLHPAFPGVLAAVVLGICWSLGPGYEGPVVGEFPAGALPRLTLDLPWTELPGLALPALVIALIGFAEPASIATTYAEEDDTEWDPHAEFVSQGAANLAAGVLAGFPVGGSFSRSALNRISGARTRWAGAITGVAVLLVLPFGALLASLPRAVLGAIVIGAAASLLRPGPIGQTLRSGRRNATIAIGTCAATVACAPRIEIGVLAGVALAALSAAYDWWSE